jgi:hypothetical protein
MPLMIQCGKMCRAGQAAGDIIRRMRFACRLTKAADTRTQYVIPTTFPRQRWLRLRASILRYTYIACLVDPVLNKIYSYRVPTDYSCTNYFNIIPSSVLSLLLI